MEWEGEWGRLVIVILCWSVSVLSLTGGLPIGVRAPEGQLSYCTCKAPSKYGISAPHFILGNLTPRHPSPNSHDRWCLSIATA